MQQLEGELAARGASMAAAVLGGANLTGLVFGCIEAKFCKKICVGLSYLFEEKIEKKGHGERLKNESS